MSLIIGPFFSLSRRIDESIDPCPPIEYTLVPNYTSLARKLLFIIERNAVCTSSAATDRSSFETGPDGIKCRYLII